MGILAFVGLRKSHRARRAGDKRRASDKRRRAVAPRVEGMEQRALLATTATITQTLTLPATHTNFGYSTGNPAQALSPALNLFNPALGTLVDVRVTGNANLTSQIKAENTSTSSGTTITATVKGIGNPSSTDATFQVDGLNFTLTGAGGPTNTATVGPFDGTIDFQPPSGVTFPPLVVTNTVNQTFTDAASLSFYTASASRTTVSPTMSAQAFASASAPTGNLATSVETTAGATLTISYDYIPGPASIARFGVHKNPTSLVVTFNTPVTATDAQNVNNYAILTSGRDRRFGTRDDVVIPINAAIFNTTTNAVTLIPAISLDIHQPYQLVYQFTGQTTPTVIPFNRRNLAGFNYHGGRFFAVVGGRVVR